MGGFYTTFANARFDVRSEEPIQYHSDLLSFNQSFYDRLPDPTLGYNDSRGSDVLNVLQKFLDNNEAPLCGSLVYILVGRYPDEANVSNLINQLRQNHVFVHFISKATPSAGTDSKALFDIASATNGLCTFADGNEFFASALDAAHIPYFPFQLISQNYVVSGSGKIEIPVFYVPNPYSTPEVMMVAITLQDHPLDNNVSVNYTIASVDETDVWNGPADPQTGDGQHGTGIIEESELKGLTNYKWTIDYNYPDNKTQRIEARLYSTFYQDFLPLPPI